MKILIFFLLGVISSVQTMEKESVVSRCSTPAGSLPSCYFLIDFPDEIKIKFFEYTADEGSVKDGIKNVQSLAYSCKDFFRLFNDEQFIKNLILRLEKRAGEPKIQSDDKKTLYYWRLLAVVTKLKNKIALKWFFKQVGTKGPIKDLKRISSKECMDLAVLLKENYGGLNVAEYRFINKRPIKILEADEPCLYGQQKARLVKVLSLKSCGLINLDGLLSLYDLPTVDVFDVSGNVISEIDAECLGRFENLVTLDLANNNLQSINLGIFVPLKKLKTIDISVNKIKTVLCALYNDGPNLDKLDLSHNNIEYINPGVIEKISARIIDLTNNKVKNAESLKALSKSVTKRILVDE